MQWPRLPFVDAHSRCEQTFVEGAPRKPNSSNVSFRARRQHADVNPPSGGGDEQGYHVVVGCKVSIGEVERLPSACDRSCKKPLGGGATKRRSRVEQTCGRDTVRKFIQRRASSHKHARCFSPCCRKGGLQLLDRRTLEAHISFAPRAVVPAIAEPLIIDAETACPSDSAV